MVVLAIVGHAVVLAIWPDAHLLLIDLQVYRAGGEHVLAGEPLYGGGVLLTLPFVYPPTAALLFVPLSVLPLTVLKIVWTAMSLAAIGYVVRRCGAGTGWSVIALVAVATWLDPVRTTLYLGQINLLLLALVVGDVLGRPGSRWRGVGVGAAAALKLTPLLFVGYLLLIGRIRAAVTALGVFAATVALGFVLAPADSATYWLGGTFLAADRISPPAATTNHSLNGLLARTFGEVPVAYLIGAAALVGLTGWLARRAHRSGDDLLAVTLCGLCTAAVAPFAWSHHWVWTVPLLVLVVARQAWWALAGLLVATLAVITALPGPGVGPIPRTGLISLWPEAYLALFIVTLVVVAWGRWWWPSGCQESHLQDTSRREGGFPDTPTS